MTAAPRTIGPLRTLSEAHELMRAHRIHHLPVLAGDKLVGIVSQRDLLLIESVAGDLSFDVERGEACLD